MYYLVKIELPRNVVDSFRISVLTKERPGFATASLDPPYTTNLDTTDGIGSDNECHRYGFKEVYQTNNIKSFSYSDISNLNEIVEDIVRFGSELFDNSIDNIKRIHDMTYENTKLFRLEEGFAGGLKDIQYVTICKRGNGGWYTGYDYTIPFGLFIRKLLTKHREEETRCAKKILTYDEPFKPVTYDESSFKPVEIKRENGVLKYSRDGKFYMKGEKPMKKKLSIEERINKQIPKYISRRIIIKELRFERKGQSVLIDFNTYFFDKKRKKFEHVCVKDILGKSKTPYQDMYSVINNEGLTEEHLSRVIKIAYIKKFISVIKINDVLSNSNNVSLALDQIISSNSGKQQVNYINYFTKRYIECLSE